MIAQFNNFLDFFRSASTTVATAVGQGVLTFDIVALAIVFLVLFLFGMYFGKAHLTSLVISFYPAMLLYDRLPFMDSLVFLKGENLLALNHVVIFTIILVLCDIIVLRFIFAESKGGPIHFLHIAAGALALLVLLLVLTYTVINLDMLHDFSSTVDRLFMNHTYAFWWYLAPLLLLFLI
jgi:hypothetical protein